MGGRISISFRNGNEESVALFSHCDGLYFLEIVERFLHELTTQLKADDYKDFYPLSRLEPSNVMVNFIGFLFRGMIRNSELSYSNYYLGATPADGDNSDNGHYVFDLKKTVQKVEVFSWGKNREVSRR